MASLYFLDARIVVTGPVGVRDISVCFLSLLVIYSAASGKVGGSSVFFTYTVVTSLAYLIHESKCYFLEGILHLLSVYPCLI